MTFGSNDVKVSGLRREIDSAFSELIHERWRSSTTARWEPPADIFENDEAYFLTVDLPGVSDNGVKCTVEDHRVILSGSRTTAISTPVARRVMEERVAGSFYRALYFTSAVDPQKTEMTWEHGVFRAVLPKRSKRIDGCPLRPAVESRREGPYGG